MMARQHLQALSSDDRRRLGELVRRGRNLDATERAELRALAEKLEPQAFAMAAVDKLSPVDRKPRNPVSWSSIAMSIDWP